MEHPSNTKKVRMDSVENLEVHSTDTLLNGKEGKDKKDKRREKKREASSTSLKKRKDKKEGEFVFDALEVLKPSAEQIEKAKSDMQELSRHVPNKEITLVFQDICKYVMVQLNPKKKEKTKKQILFDVSGCVKPGEIMALMGPSGSGKTSLLNILGGRSQSNMSGTLKLNGEPFIKAMKRKIAYVMQEDVFFDHLTVREQLLYTALLRFPRKMTSEQKVAQVNAIIKTLNIERCANSPIMFVSGGERKRVNIGTELLTNPTLILMDEPTSGLDSTTAVALMKTLRLLAIQGRTIITSIHQPSSQVYNSFDKLLLLADGKTIYNGPPRLTTDYFHSLGFPSPAQYNPADFIMDLVNAENNPRALLQEKYIEIGSKNVEIPTIEFNKISLVDEKTKFPTSYLDQLQVLIRRNALNSKSKLFTVLNFTQSVALAIITGLVWLRIPENDLTIIDRQGFIFFVMTFWPFQTLFSGILSFPSERSVLLKERASGSYRLSAYFLAKSLSEAPILILLPFIFLVISYWMANLNSNFGAFIGFSASELLCVLAAESIGLFLGVAETRLDRALVIATVSMLGIMLVGGFFVRNIPSFLSWSKYLSIFKYSFDACLIMEFGEGTKFTCSEDSPIPQCLGREYITGEEVLDYLGITGVNRSMTFNILMLFAFFIFFRIMAYIFLRFFNTRHLRD